MRVIFVIIIIIIVIFGSLPQSKYATIGRQFANIIAAVVYICRNSTDGFEGFLFFHTRSENSSIVVRLLSDYSPRIQYYIYIVILLYGVFRVHNIETREIRQRGRCSNGYWSGLIPGTWYTDAHAVHVKCFMVYLRVICRGSMRC